MTTTDERGPQSGARLIDVVRHDLATPLAVARGSIDHLRREPSRLTPERRAEILAALDRSIAALERLSGNLRSDWRLEHPGLRDEFGEIRTGDLMAEVIFDVGDLAAQREVKVDVQVEQSVAAAFEGSSSLVRQALENLLTNAIRYSPRRGVVSLICRREEAAVRFEVSDEGAGIPTSQQARLFDPLGPASTRTGRGEPGIGLSIVRRVAEAHDGRVGVESQPGVGSTFWVTFPLTH